MPLYAIIEMPTHEIRDMKHKKGHKDSQKITISGLYFHRDAERHKKETSQGFEASDSNKHFVEKETSASWKYDFKEDLSSGHRNGLGIQGLMQSFTGKTPFQTLGKKSSTA